MYLSKISFLLKFKSDYNLMLKFSEYKHKLKLSRNIIPKRNGLISAVI